MSTYKEALEQANAMSANCPEGYWISIREPSPGYYYADFVKPRSMGMVCPDIEQHMLSEPEYCPHNPGSRSTKHHNIVLGLNKRSKR